MHPEMAEQNALSGLPGGRDRGFGINRTTAIETNKTANFVFKL